MNLLLRQSFCKAIQSAIPNDQLVQPIDGADAVIDFSPGRLPDNGIDPVT